MTFIISLSYQYKHGFIVQTNASFAGAIFTVSLPGATLFWLGVIVLVSSTLEISSLLEESSLSSPRPHKQRSEAKHKD